MTVCVFFFFFPIPVVLLVCVLCVFVVSYVRVFSAGSFVFRLQRYFLCFPRAVRFCFCFVFLFLCVGDLFLFFICILCCVFIYMRVFFVYRVSWCAVGILLFFVCRCVCVFFVVFFFVFFFFFFLQLMLFCSYGGCVLFRMSVWFVCVYMYVYVRAPVGLFRLPTFFFSFFFF